MSEQIPILTNEPTEGEGAELDTTAEDNEEQEADRSQEIANDLKNLFGFKNYIDIDLHQKVLADIIEKGTGSESEKDLMNNIKETLDEIEYNRKINSSFSRNFSDIVKGNFEEDMRGLSADMRGNAREYINSLLIYAENPESSMKSRDNESEEEGSRIIQIRKMLSELNNFLDNRVTEINNIKNADELERLLKDDQYLLETIKKSADLDMSTDVTESLKQLRHVSGLLVQHVRKTEPWQYFSTIREMAEMYIEDLPTKINRDAAGKYVDALIKKVEEVVGEMKD